MADNRLPLRGDESELYARLAERLLSFVASQVDAPRAVIEDACSIAWMTLLRCQPDRRTVWGWLRVVGVREAWRLSSRERRELEFLTDRAPADLLTAVATIDTIVELHTEMQILRDTIDARKRRILLLHATGYTYEEIGKITGDSRRTVERQLLRARRRARNNRADPRG